MQTKQFVCSTRTSHIEKTGVNRFFLYVRVGRIELPNRAWQARVIPLNHTRFIFYRTDNMYHKAGL
jgi:hypothetical protein